MNNEWQPIETAPRDRRVLLCMKSKNIACGQWQADEYAKRPKPYWWYDTGWMAGKTHVRANQPTHWMPLPEPPESDL